MKNVENAVSPVDFERLREVCGDDAEMINEIVELYFSQTREQLDELEKALPEKNYDGIYKAAHKIAGGSLTCGMNAIVQPIRELEQIGRNQTGDNIEDLLEQARRAFEQMQRHFETKAKELLI